MEDLINRLATVKTETIRATGQTDTFEARLGDGNGRLINANAQFAGAVYVYYDETETGARAVETAILDAGAGIPYEENLELLNQKVTVARPAGEKQLHVIRQNAQAAFDTYGATPIKQQETNALGSPIVQQIATLKTRLTDPDNPDKTLTIDGPYIYPAPITLAQTKFEESTADYSTTIAAFTASTKHCIALSCLDRLTNAATYLALAEVTAINTPGTDAAREEFSDADIDSFDLLNNPTYTPSAVVYLYYGQTAFAEADILKELDPRPQFPPPSAFISLKHKYNATTAPTTGDDTGDGYSVGSKWYDLTNDNIYECIDATLTAAVWKKQSTTSGGSGDVVGPSSATDEAIVRFDGTTGKLVQNSAVTIADSGSITQIIGGVSLIISHAYSGSNRTTGLIITTPGASTDNVIQPSGDFKALIVKGNASQTANLQEWQNSGGTQLAAISSIGHATFGSSTTPPATTIITSVKTFTDPAAQTFALNATVTSALTANNANALRGAQMAATSDPNGNNQTGTVVGGLFLGTSTGTGGTISTVHGGQFGIQNAGTSVTMTNARGIYVQSPTNSGTITVLTGILIDAQNTAGITTVRALDIINQGASNTAIRAGTGLVQFGDRVNIIGSQDAVQLIVRANATQTSNLTEWQNSSATILTKVNGSGNVGVRMGSTALTAYLHIAAGTTSASTAPIKLTSGTSMTAAEAGAIEFTTDDLFFTITTGTARKRILFADPSGGLTSGRVPFATTNGRLTDSADLTWDGSVLDVAGTLRGNALRLDLSPTSETITPTHTITISVNGTDYKIPIVAA